MKETPKYKLKEWEKSEEEAVQHPPHFCPNCGNSINATVGYWTDSHRPSTPEEPFKGLGYDCYCPICHWSGQIEPDEDHCIVEERVEPMKFVKFPFRKKRSKKK